MNGVVDHIPVGTRFGHCVVAEPARMRRGKTVYGMRCDCGTTWETRQDVLRAGRAHSCGCKSVERMSEKKKIHGHCLKAGFTPTWGSWKSMIERCYRTEHKSYPRYGGRGIGVCSRWRESYSAFLADMGPRPDGMSIERSDGNGNYEPSNCRWATLKEQAQNRSTTLKLSVGGKVLCLADAAKAVGVAPGTILRRSKKFSGSHQSALDQLIGVL